ncbi:MAG: DNA polymerase IV [Woeseiaceae bacterium]
MTQAARSILHVDMDAFYASVEQRDNPALRGKPVVVGGSSKRGVVAAASYEARVFGIRSAMPIAEARRRCPHLCHAKVRMSHYQQTSAAIFNIFREFTPLVEGLSLDEAFLDVTASISLFGSPEVIAAQVKQRIFDATALRASVGVAANKLVAKIASDLDKPDGLTVLYPADYPNRLDPLPIAVIPGIGPQTRKRLDAIQVRTVRDLRTAPERLLTPIFGRYTQSIVERAAGIDERPVRASRAEKSISAEETFDMDLVDRAAMERELLRLAERTTTRLRKHGLGAGTVQVKIRQSDFTTCTRQRSIKPPTSSTDQIHAIACDLLHTWLERNAGARVRLLGVGGSNLATVQQGDLFAADNAEPVGRVDQTVDAIRDRFGTDSLERASTLERH